MRQVLDENLKQWETYSETERRNRTLNPEDSIFTPSHSIQHEKPPSEVFLSPSYSQDLEALKALRDDGIFSEDEFQRQKAKSKLIEQK